MAKCSFPVCEDTNFKCEYQVYSPGGQYMPNAQVTFPDLHSRTSREEVHLSYKHDSSFVQHAVIKPTSPLFYCCFPLHIVFAGRMALTSEVECLKCYVIFIYGSTCLLFINQLISGIIINRATMHLIIYRFTLINDSIKK